MRRLWGLVVAALAIALLPGGSTVAADRGETRIVGTWQPPPGLRQVPIWPGTAPGMTGAQPPERVLTVRTPEAIGGTTSQAVFDVSVPTMTVFPAKGAPTRAAIVVFPGGGFKADVITSEGTEICDWLAAQGIVCVLSKYRVPNSGHHYDASCRCGVQPKVPRALQDAQRTIRLVRSQAKALGVDPAKIGAMGFSAGGYLVAQTSNILAPAYAPVDAVDRVSSRPDFAVIFYPGHLCRPGTKLDPGITVTQQAPPTFLIQAWNDPIDEICNATLYARALDDAGVPSEVHLFAKGGHAFTLRKTDAPVAVWPGLLTTWLKGIGILR